MSVRISFSYMNCLLMMCREPQGIIDFYVGLTEEVVEVGISVGPCTSMIPITEEVAGFASYDVSQSSFYVGE